MSLEISDRATQSFERTISLSRNIGIRIIVECVLRSYGDSRRKRAARNKQICRNFMERTITAASGKPFRVMTPVVIEQ